MIAIDIGGTKTLIMFSSKSRMKEFLDETDFDVINANPNDKYCTIRTSSIMNEANFHRFVSTLKSIDKEVISTFPGIVRVEYGKRIKFRVYSQRFPFLIGKHLDFDFVLNDAPAFTYFHAADFFKKRENAERTIMGVVIGTGINACHMNLWDFKRLTFINRIFEAGHVRFDGNEKCFCGRRGCAELHVSGKFLEKIGGGNPERVFSDERLMEVFYRNISDFFISLIITVSPHEIVIGGSVSKSVDMTLLKEKIESGLPHSRVDTGIRIRKDLSPLPHVKGLILAYRRFKQKYRL